MKIGSEEDISKLLIRLRGYGSGITGEIRDHKTVKFTYQGEYHDAGIHNARLDKAIHSNAKSNRLKFYASGYNYLTGVRDICFDLPEKLRRKESLCE